MFQINLWINPKFVRNQPAIYNYLFYFLTTRSKLNASFCSFEAITQPFKMFCSKFQLIKKKFWVNSGSTKPISGMTINQCYLILRKLWINVGWFQPNDQSMVVDFKQTINGGWFQAKFGSMLVDFEQTIDQWSLISSKLRINVGWFQAKLGSMLVNFEQI